MYPCGPAFQAGFGPGVESHTRQSLVLPGVDTLSPFPFSPLLARFLNDAVLLSSQVLGFPSCWLMCMELCQFPCVEVVAVESVQPMEKELK